MDSFYALAGRLIEYYRIQNYKKGDVKFNLKNFTLDENGAVLCSFPTYKKIANGEVVKNSGFYMLLARKLNLNFDLPYVFNDAIIEKYETEFIYLVEKHSVSEIKKFLPFFDDKFSKMNQSLVMLELREAFKLLEYVFGISTDDNRIDENKIYALIYASKTPSFVLSLYYLLYVYYHCMNVNLDKEINILKSAHLIESDFIYKTYLEALFEKNEVTKENLVSEFKNSNQIWKNFIYYYVLWNDVDKPLSKCLLKEIEKFYHKMKQYSSYFTNSEMLWIGQLLAKHCYYYEMNDLAVIYAKENLKITSKATYPSLLILFNIYLQQNIVIENDKLELYDQSYYPNVLEVNIILDYLKQRISKDGVKKAESLIMKRIMPLYQTKKDNYFLNYFFFQELKLCVKITGHTDYVQIYTDKVMV